MGNHKEEALPDPETDQMHVATQINSIPQEVNETLWKYIQRFTDLVIQATGTYPIAVICQVTIVLFIRHLLIKKLKCSLLEEN